MIDAQFEARTCAAFNMRGGPSIDASARENLLFPRSRLAMAAVRFSISSYIGHSITRRASVSAARLLVLRYYVKKKMLNQV